MYELDNIEVIFDSEEMNEKAVEFINTFAVVLYVIVFYTLLVSFFIVFYNSVMNIYDKNYEYGILRSLGYSKKIKENKEEETITVTIEVQKADWIYIETKDQYPNIKDLIVTTSDGRVISEDMIWRENGKIFVLDDPDVVYHFIYQGAISQGVESNSQSSSLTSEIPWVYLGYIAVIMLLIIGCVILFKKRKKWSDKYQKKKEAFDEVDTQTPGCLYLK